MAGSRLRLATSIIHATAQAQCPVLTFVSICAEVAREMGLSERRWQGQIRGTENIYWRAIGSADSLMELAEDLGQKWLRGIRAVTALERSG